MAVNFNDLGDDGIDWDKLSKITAAQHNAGDDPAKESDAQAGNLPPESGPSTGSSPAPPPVASGPSGDDEIPLSAYADEFQRERSVVWTPPDRPKTATVPILDASWPDPVNVWDSADTSRLAIVAPEMLPAAIAPYVFDQADRAGVDVNQVALNCYTACAAMIRAGIGLQMQEDMGDGGRVWTEYAVLWAAVIGMFSEKKGVGLDVAVDYLKSTDTRQRMKEQQAWDSYEDEEKGYQSELKEYQRDIKKKPALERPTAPEKPPRSRLWTDDATLQAMAKLFTENPRGKVSVIKDELSGWFGAFDAFTAGKSDIDRPAFLSFYESKQRLIDRVGSGFYAIDRWGGCIIGGIQPDILAKVAAKLGGDGMLQRFQIITSRPARQVPRRPADTKATALWQKTQESLFQMEQRGNPVKLSKQAAEYMDDRVQWINKALNAGLTPSLAGAIGKWEGLFGRLMITSHCIHAASRGVTIPYPEVDLSTAQQAWAWMHGLLWPHAIHFYTSIADKGADDSHLILFGKYLLARPETTIIKPGYLPSEWTHYKRTLRTTFERKEFWQSAVNAGFVLPNEEYDRNLQIAKTYRVNPKLHDGRFAQFAQIAKQQKDAKIAVMPKSWVSRD